jgi:GNAT superfamily N-acetyltransferase
MNIHINPAETIHQWTTVFKIRTQVFTNEWGFSFDPLPGPGAQGVWHFLASDDRGHGIATLSIVDTTLDLDLHQRYHMRFPQDDRVARYAQLAVLRPYRGLGIPEQMIQVSQSHVIHPESFDYGWLLFPAGRTADSQLTKSLDFKAHPAVLTTEFGACQVLIRDETAYRANQPQQGEAQALDEDSAADQLAVIDI